MGTSRAQRSPNTHEWALVNALYRDPSATPETIASAIVAAVDVSTQAEMSGVPVANCLGALLYLNDQVNRHGLLTTLTQYGQPAGPPALALASATRTAARDAILRGRISSLFGSLAVDAATSSALEAATLLPRLDPITADLAAVQAAFGSYAAERNLSGLSGLFISHDLGRVFEHFVARDLPQHVGGPAIPDVASAAVLTDRVRTHVQETTRRLALAGVEDQLWRTLRLEAQQRAQQLMGFTRDAIGEGLSVLQQGEQAP